MDTEKIRPFLKWAGGKYHIIGKIHQILPPGNRLIEPFAGAASVFLNTNYISYLLADINQDLINCFHYLQKEQQVFINYCKQFFQDKYNNKSSFHFLRKEFNTSHDKRFKAALFVYLNRHCFNGLMRYNQSGLFNTSFGTYKKPYFPENEMKAFAEKAVSAKIICANYTDTMAEARKGDIVYCDPPYVPLSSTSSFTSYHASGFRQDDQEKLVSMAWKLAKEGIPVILSNHDNKFVHELYMGANIISFPVPRYISCQTNNRKKVSEILALFN